MNKLLQVLVVDGIIGENGMPAHKNSGSKLLDAFYKLGASRAVSDEEILSLWLAAWKESVEGTLRLAFFNRDVRGGQGERRTFRIFWKWLCINHPDIAINNIPNVPFFGRWDDLWIGAFETKVMPRVGDFVHAALLGKDLLCGKWMPREGKKYDKIAKWFMNYWGITPKAYRLLCARNTQVIETLMCAGQFGRINYPHVPSQAAKKYRKAFMRRDEIRYREYLAALVRGDKGVKVNAGAIYPHEILSPIRNLLVGFRRADYKQPTQAEIDLVNAQWKSQPEITAKGEKYLPIVDTSGSMSGLPIEVAVALGIYLSERNESVFKNCFITFSSEPAFHHFKGENVSDKLRSMDCSGWNMNTNIGRVFDLVLNTATRNNLPPEAMPAALIILSDMQFDYAVEGGYNLNIMQLIDRKFARAGYTRPRIIYWNLRDAFGVPVKYDESGTALVSGFSPNIMSTIFKGSNPLQVLINTLGAERYDRVVI